MKLGPRSKLRKWEKPQGTSNMTAKHVVELVDAHSELEREVRGSKKNKNKMKTGAGLFPLLPSIWGLFFLFL